MSKDLPTNLLYNNDYSWVKIEDDVAILGIIKPACDKIEEFVFVKLPEKGQKIKRGEVYASLEAIKWSGHLSSPFTGEIIEVNEDIFDEPSIINEDPYGKGWIAKIKLANKEEKDDLVSAEEVKEV
ncbi:MAG TPA: glycine cleavage system protein GcvH [Patescibacteria group bacterium]|nr:glycine cleavage system protein GcvH [Patescibacteria group bacterium]